MYFLGFFFLFFGIIIIKEPALLAYIIAWFFILIGLKLLLIAHEISKRHSDWKKENVFSFGDYEIIKKHK